MQESLFCALTIRCAIWNNRLDPKPYTLGSLPLQNLGNALT